MKRIFQLQRTQRTRRKGIRKTVKSDDNNISNIKGFIEYNEDT